jgi:hypothetical protein
MRLYAANVTHQRREFYYRRDFIAEGSSFIRQNNSRRVVIEPGRQVAIEGDLLPDQAQVIMDQMAIYGGVGVEEFNRVPLKQIVYLMSYGKEVPLKMIHMAKEHNQELLTNEGDVRRRNAAIAAHPVIDGQIDSLKKLDIEMLEVPPERGEPDPVGKTLDFGAHVDPNARRADDAPSKGGRLSRKRVQR